VCRGKRRGDSRLCRNSVRRNFRDREGKNRGRCGIWGQEMIRENIFFKCNITRNEKKKYVQDRRHDKPYNGEDNLRKHIVEHEEKIYHDFCEWFEHSINTQTLVNVNMMVVFEKGVHRVTYD
jgi:hypothetical protein